ncbi:AraC family transcriptional regulator [Paenibacillus sp. NEAU-GSW1]|uniref:helix-turn-helix domain-containing protein n=1 Tax=Paenibacillus sp. NEAU-GSW1 TaxID=2682486 RepID=UPI00139F0F97|nr:AraC family transcriptional regulator [Paenibacillus sp. NEAU-GSW1]
MPLNTASYTGTHSAFRERPLSVQQVSAAAGFADPLYFAKQFMRRFGITPTDYRHGKRSSR